MLHRLWAILAKAAAACCQAAVCWSEVLDGGQRRRLAAMAARISAGARPISATEPMAAVEPMAEDPSAAAAAGQLFADAAAGIAHDGGGSSGEAESARDAMVTLLQVHIDHHPCVDCPCVCRPESPWIMFS